MKSWNSHPPARRGNCHLRGHLDEHAVGLRPEHQAHAGNAIQPGRQPRRHRVAVAPHCAARPRAQHGAHGLRGSASSRRADPPACSGSRIREARSWSKNTTAFAHCAFRSSSSETQTSTPARQVMSAARTQERHGVGKRAPSICTRRPKRRASAPTASTVVGSVHRAGLGGLRKAQHVRFREVDVTAAGCCICGRGKVDLPVVAGHMQDLGPVREKLRRTALVHLDVGSVVADDAVVGLHIDASASEVGRRSIETKKARSRLENLAIASQAAAVQRSSPYRARGRCSPRPSQPTPRGTPPSSCRLANCLRSQLPLPITPSPCAVSVLNIACHGFPAHAPQIRMELAFRRVSADQERLSATASTISATSLMACLQDAPTLPHWQCPRGAAGDEDAWHRRAGVGR